MWNTVCTKQVLRIKNKFVRNRHDRRDSDRHSVLIPLYRLVLRIYNAERFQNVYIREQAGAAQSAWLSGPGSWADWAAQQSLSPPSGDFSVRSGQGCNLEPHTHLLQTGVTFPATCLLPGPRGNKQQLLSLTFSDQGDAGLRDGRVVGGEVHGRGKRSISQLPNLSTSPERESTSGEVYRHSLSQKKLSLEHILPGWRRAIFLPGQPILFQEEQCDFLYTHGFCSESCNSPSRNVMPVHSYGNVPLAPLYEIPIKERMIGHCIKLV